MENTPTVVVGLQGHDVRLSWGDNAMNTGGYIVWRSADTYFQPDDTRAISITLPAGTTSYTHSGAASSGVAWFYLVEGVSGAGVRSSVSNRKGIFGFGLMPGALQGITPPASVILRIGRSRHLTGLDRLSLVMRANTSRRDNLPVSNDGESPMPYSPMGVSNGPIRQLDRLVAIGADGTICIAPLWGRLHAVGESSARKVYLLLVVI